MIMNDSGSLVVFGRTIGFRQGRVSLSCLSCIPDPACLSLRVGHDDMPLYKVIIHGGNFRLKVEGKWEKFGFYTPRFAEALDAAVAEQVAVEDFRRSQRYQDLLASSLNSERDPPFIRGEDITPASQDSGKVPAGLALYRESDV